VDDKIISIHKDGPTESQMEMIEMLTRVIKECEQGDVSGFYMVIDRGDGNWAERVSRMNGLQMLGILEVMREQMLRALISE